MTPADTVAIALILSFGLVLGGGILVVFLVTRVQRQERGAGGGAGDAWTEDAFPVLHNVVASAVPRPVCWLAIKSRHTLSVQTVLALNNPIPCSWSDGLMEDQQLFISPPVNGWTLVMGNGLPCPGDDVDDCFRFLTALSRKLGHVQFFQADRVLRHHAWVRLEAGRVVRAYAWAGQTLWHQGAKSAPESALGMKCFAYDESPSSAPWTVGDLVAANVEKVSLLAGRWSVNPAAIDVRFWAQRPGIAGWLSRRHG